MFTERPSPLPDVQAGSKPTHLWPLLLPCPMSTPWVSSVGHALPNNSGDFWSFAVSLYQFKCESPEDLPEPIKTGFATSHYSLRLTLSVFSGFAHAVPLLSVLPNLSTCQGTSGPNSNTPFSVTLSWPLTLTSLLFLCYWVLQIGNFFTLILTT